MIQEENLQVSDPKPTLADWIKCSAAMSIFAILILCILIAFPLCLISVFQIGFRASYAGLKRVVRVINSA